MDKVDKEKHKILIVDDEDGNRDLLTRILRRRFDVRTAKSGPEALGLLRKDGFAAILSDQRMPGMTGTEFLAEARRLVPDTVRMIVTGYGADQDPLDAINVAHVTSFLTKPIVPEVLEHAISDAIEIFELGMRNQDLIRELEAKNRELAEAKHLLEMSLDERTRALLEANRRLEELALRDSLTGLYNHRFLHERLVEEIERLKRYGARLSLVICDIDLFRVYNEHHGHPAGDKLLVEVSRILAGATRASDVVARIRPTDMVARFGGEEYALIVPATPKAGAAVMCERIRGVLAAARLPGVEIMPGGKLTLSFGIAEAPTDASSSMKLIEAAESALLRAKKSGRNCVELY